MPDFIQNWDWSVMERLQSTFHSAWGDAVFPLVTHLGDKGLVWLAAAVLLLLSRRNRKLGLMVLAALAISFLLGEILLKNMVQRPRPFALDPAFALLIPPEAGFSFPSSHSATGFAAACTIFYKKKGWGLLALLLAGGIAFSRLYLYVHFPTDVLAGAALGIISAMLTRKLFRKINRFFNPRFLLRLK